MSAGRVRIRMDGNKAAGGKVTGGRPFVVAPTQRRNPMRIRVILALLGLLAVAIPLTISIADASQGLGSGAGRDEAPW